MTLNAPAAAVLAQQSDSAVALTIQVRTADGSAMVGETVSLQRLPENTDTAPLCKTNEQGKCTWYVGRGLYQVLFARPLDEVSTLALAEGGLRGFGLTVGEENIAYHFTVHSDKRVYFDAAPDAAIPVPIIPTAEHLHGGAEALPTPEATATPTVTTEAALVVAGSGEVAELTVAPALEPEEPTTMDGRWRLLILATSGLIAGSGLHGWTRRRNQENSPVRRSLKPANEPANKDWDHA